MVLKPQDTGGATDRGEYAWLAENVRYLAEENGYTLGQVAGLAGFSERSLMRYLNDPTANPETDKVMSLARQLRVHVYYLWLEPATLRAKIEEEGLPLPFVPPRPALRRVDSTSSEASATRKVERVKRRPRTG